jgi:hypothetical protein
MKFSIANPKRTGRSLELKRISPKPPGVMDSDKTENIPCDFNKEGKGKINYDPVSGWVPFSNLGAITVGIDIKHNTNHLKRVDGLPGSRP